MTKRGAVNQPVRLTDQISFGVLGKTLAQEAVNRVLVAQGRRSRRVRDLPAHGMVYYGVAMAIYMGEAYREILRRLVEGMTWLMGPEERVEVAGKAAISRARSRLGWEVVRQLYEEVVQPIAEQRTRGAWYRQWHLVSLDGSTLDMADTEENDRSFGRPSASRGRSAYPQLRFVARVENGTHVLFGSEMGPYATGETTRGAVVAEGDGMLGRPFVLRFRAVEAGDRERGGLGVADQEKYTAALRQTSAGRLLPQPDLSLPERSAAQP